MARKALLKQAAPAVGISVNALYWMARRGEVPYIKIGNRYVFDLDQLEEHLKNMALDNLKHDTDESEEKVISYGTLRKIKA